MKLPYLRKCLIAVVLFFAVLALAVVGYFAIPLPRPNLSIEFQGFEPGKKVVFELERGTNEDDRIFFSGTTATNWWLRVFPGFQSDSTMQTDVVCTLYLTNRGPARIWWVSRAYRVEAKTPQGWMTNIFSDYFTPPWNVRARERYDFDVCVPVGAVEWRVSSPYVYFRRHQARLEYVDWISGDRRLPPEMATPLYGAANYLRYLPEPLEKRDNMYSQFFTNTPAADLPLPHGVK